MANPSLKAFLQKALSLDRRWIFLIVLIVVVVPTIVPLNLPVTVTHEVRDVYDSIEALPDGSYMFVSFDYEPASTPECDPQALALMRHCFQKKMKVVAVTFIPQGSGIGERILNQMKREFDLKYGEDFVWLGYRPGNQAMIIGLTQDLKGTFRTDVYGTDTTDAARMPILKDVKTLKDFPYLICIHDDSQIDSWVIYANERIGIKIASACTALMAAGIYPYYNVGQLTGIIGGLKGASEYEKLLKDSAKFQGTGINPVGFGTKGMDAQSIIHVFVILMIIFGNVAHIALRRLS
ncbi:MAG: hypothetical protein Kow0059_04550 [Candidatus Sumerlaeia bacterium]